MDKSACKRFRQIVLWSLICLPPTVLGDSGQDAKKAQPVMKGMIDGSTKTNIQGGSNAPDWMAPADAAKRKNPVAASTASIRRGKKAFEANCANCHGPIGKGDGAAGAALSPRPADLVAMAGQHRDGDLAWKIEHGRGHGSMPAFQVRLSEAQIWDIVNFIQGLAPRAPGQRKHRSSGH